MSSTSFWHPFADMASARETPFLVDRAEGVWVWDGDGRRYFDASASLWYANVGHGRREIADAVHAQMMKLEAYSTYGETTNAPAEELASRLAAVAPMAEAKVFFGLGGADAIETAAKLARRYWIEAGEAQRVHLISRTNGYHGSHGIGTSIGGIDANTNGWGPLVGETSKVPWNSAEALASRIEELGAERVAAFFVEPVIGAGGVLPPPEGYMESVAAICARTGVLLVIDAVICGFGRLGTWFAVERWGIKPDLIVFAKGVTSGYLPLGGVIVSDRVAEPFWGGGVIFRHGQTYSGHPTSCAAAIANLDILEQEGLIERGRALESVLLEALQPLARSSVVAEVRGGVGFLAAVELDADVRAARPTAIAELTAAIRDRGVFVRPLGTSIGMSPPLIADESHIALLADAVGDALAQLESACTATMA